MCRREKNRLAARKCRAKKIASMVDTEERLKELTTSNEELRVGAGFWCDDDV